MHWQVYERAAIEAWLRDHNTSPLTGEILPSKLLVCYPLQFLMQFAHQPLCTFLSRVHTSKYWDVQ